MSRLQYFICKVFSKFSNNKHEFMNDYYSKKGMKIGKDTHIFTEIVTSEPYLINIGDNTTISTNVSLLTHDASVGAIYGRNVASDICGEINIGNNCFIGNNATILYGVSLADHTVIAAGSVVTKSFNQGNIVIGGNPARVLCTTDEFYKKHNCHFMNLHGLSYEDRKKHILVYEKEKVIHKK